MARYANCGFGTKEDEDCVNATSEISWTKGFRQVR